MSCMAVRCGDDMELFAGDTNQPIIEVVDCDGNAIDLSDAQEISFSILTGAADSVIKSKTGGGIDFVTDGKDGEYQVKLAPSDTQGLSGWYSYKSIVTDYYGNIGTVRSGYVEIRP